MLHGIATKQKTRSREAGSSYQSSPGPSPKNRPDFGSEEEREGPTADRKAKLRMPSTKNGHIKERKKTPEPCSYIEKSETHRLGGELRP